MHIRLRTYDTENTPTPQAVSVDLVAFVNLQYDRICAMYTAGLRPSGLGGVEGDWSPEKQDGLRPWRQAIDRGEFVRIGVLSPESTEVRSSHTWHLVVMHFVFWCLVS
jgi:hypothetical protein